MGRCVALDDKTEKTLLQLDSDHLVISNIQ